MSRPLKIFLYFLSFFVIVYFTIILMVRASYFIPVSSTGVDFDRAYTALYIILFGLFAIIFGLVGAYAYLSNLGKLSFKEVFKYKKKVFVFSVTFFAFGLFYFVFELLFEYIILNYNNPSLTVNNNYNSVLVKEDKSFKDLDYSSKLNNTNLFLIKGVTSGFYDSVMTHYGNGLHQIVGNNTIIKAILKSNVMIDKSALYVNGNYTEGIYVDESTLNVTNSSIKVNGTNSVALFAEKSDVHLINTSISSSSDYVFVLRNKNDVLFDNVDFDISSDTNELILLNSDNSRNGSNLFLKNIKSNTPDYDFFKIEDNKSVITLDGCEINWESISEYFAYLDDSSLELHIINSKLVGGISLDMNSTLDLYLENSTYEGDIRAINGINLNIDDSSTFKPKNKVLVNSFTGSDTAKNNLLNYIDLDN